MATIHFMHGYIGFGKTTIAKKLAKELPAVRLSNDEFRVKLYGRHIAPELFQIYYDRIDTLLWGLAEQIIKTGTDVIMDYGSWRKDKRAQDFARAKTFADNVIFHSILCDLATAKARTLKRTKNKNETFIDEKIFEELLLRFEPIEESEGYQIITHDNTLNKK